MKRSLWVKVTVAALVTASNASASNSNSGQESKVKHVLSLINTTIEGEGSESKPCISQFKFKNGVIKS